MSEDLIKEQLKIVENQGFIKHNGYKVITAKENYCEIEAKITEESLNPYGIGHGGFIFGLADTAAGIAAADMNKVSLTLDSTISYFKPAKGSKIKAIAQAIKTGRQISVYEVNIYNDKEDIIARATITYFMQDKREN